jgi:hypothetical protein
VRIKNADIQSGRILGRAKRHPAGCRAANPPERIANPPEWVYIEVEWTDLESSYSNQAIANMPKRTVTPINTTNAISLKFQK